MPYALHYLGDTHIQRDEPAIARIYLTESADIFVGLRDYGEAVHLLYDLATFAKDDSDRDEASEFVTMNVWKWPDALMIFGIRFTRFANSHNFPQRREPQNPRRDISPTRKILRRATNGSSRIPG